MPFAIAVSKRQKARPDPQNWLISNIWVFNMSKIYPAKLNKWIAIIAIVMSSGYVHATEKSLDELRQVKKLSSKMMELYDKRASIQQIVSEIGAIAYVLPPENIAKLGGSYADPKDITLVWQHLGCTHSFISIDKNQRLTGLLTEWHRFSDSQMIAEGCPDFYFERETKLFSPFSCKNRKRSELCKLAPGVSGSTMNSIKKRPTTDSPEIQSQFSAFSGAHMKLEKEVKRKILVPNSFKHIETKYWIEADGLLISMRFSAINKVNVRLENQVKAKMDFEGNLIKITEWIQ